MTRKDYVLIAAGVAAGINEARLEGRDTDAARTVAIELSYRLADENGRFDRARFLTACGVQA